MDNSQLAGEIASQVISDTKFWIAIIGLVGAVIGSLLTMFGNILLHWIKEKPQSDLEKSRINMLVTMLDDDRFPQKWRSLSTLSAVIGANDEETKRLLFKAGARGSEKADGKWGLVKNHPFPSIE
ncbi:hypothetical protein [Rheinheimera sp.]|uniref:hypothetical protein n=1 Tax=Rheinheimera sp. TaxID=1869214 RepID=UPI002736DCEF|nr:hypothetical protein [Rheinheimera sp.]MDP2714149.1 hypothetical protein [Rheinheimera sp.]